MSPDKILLWTVVGRLGRFLKDLIENIYMDEDLNLKIYDFDAHSLRGKSFYEGILDYRSKILPKHKWRIKNAKDFICVLCKGKKAQLFLEWEAGYKLFSCTLCGAVSANVKGDTKHIDDVYNNNIYYEKFEKEILKHYDYRKKTQGVERYEYVVKRLRLNPKKARVLDVGCGAGYFISVLNENGVKCKGLEVNPEQVRYCKKQGLDVESTDLKAEPDDYYDAITLFDVLEHLSDPVETIKIAQRKLKKGGYLIAYTPNIHSLAYKLMGAKQNTLLPFEHFCFYSEKSFKFLAKKTGLILHTLEVRGLDVMDYLLLKEYEDGIDYTVKLKEFMNITQSLVDKLNYGNHFRLTLKKQNK